MVYLSPGLMGWLVGGTGLPGTVVWEHCHGLDSLGKQLLVPEEKGWRELVGAVVGGGRGELLGRLPGPLTMARLHSSGVS